MTVVGERWGIFPLPRPSRFGDIVTESKERNTIEYKRTIECLETVYDQSRAKPSSGIWRTDMTYIPNVISTVLFESDSATVHKIPPGDKWDLNNRTEVWKGSLRLIEQEIIIEDNDSGSASNCGVRSAFEGLRAKIELFNVINDEDVVWGEVWYNPVVPGSNGARIANNGQETIQMCHSMRDYKIIGQLPGSGYHPIMSDEKDANPKIQIGLALRLEQFLAISFLESLSLYKRRFKNYQDQFETKVIEPPPTPVLIESQQETNTQETEVEGSIPNNANKPQDQSRDHSERENEGGAHSIHQTAIEIENLVETQTRQDFHKDFHKQSQPLHQDLDNDNLTEASDDDFGEFVSS